MRASEDPPGLSFVRVLLSMEVWKLMVDLIASLAQSRITQGRVSFGPGDQAGLWGCLWGMISFMLIDVYNWAVPFLRFGCRIT